MARNLGNLDRAGARAMPIAAPIGFLVGVTLSYLTAQQLKSCGADILVVNILPKCYQA